MKGYQPLGSEPDSFSRSFINSTFGVKEYVSLGDLTDALYEFLSTDRGTCGPADVHNDVDTWKRKQGKRDFSKEFLGGVVKDFIAERDKTTVSKKLLKTFFLHYGSLSVCMNNVAENFVNLRENSPREWTNPREVLLGTVLSDVDQEAKREKKEYLDTRAVFAIAPTKGEYGRFLVATGSPDGSRGQFTIELVQKIETGTAVQWASDYAYITRKDSAAARRAVVELGRKALPFEWGTESDGTHTAFRALKKVAVMHGLDGSDAYRAVLVGVNKESSLPKTQSRASAAIRPENDRRSVGALFVTFMT